MPERGLHSWAAWQKGRRGRRRGAFGTSLGTLPGARGWWCRQPEATDETLSHLYFPHHEASGGEAAGRGSPHPAILSLTDLQGQS